MSITLKTISSQANCLHVSSYGEKGLCSTATAGSLICAPDVEATWESVTQGPLRVVVSIDVEEEGLFSGVYARQGCTVHNVALLRKLVPLSTELGFPLTLLCAHTVFGDAQARHTLEFMRDHAGAEIGAHLHHWSTPPFAVIEDGPAALSTAGQHAETEQAPLRTHLLPDSLLRQRLRMLLDAGRDFQGAALTSFRMGRWDLKAAVRPMLAQEGILVDSSICPLRVFRGTRKGEAPGADHFLAPTDPYWPVYEDGCAPLLESPITQVPLQPWLARLWYATMRGTKYVDTFRVVGALSPNPVWHSAAVMRWAARLHVARKGRVLHMFWHSSEMLAGASPNIPDAAAAEALLVKIRDYLVWLKEHFGAQGVTLSSLFNLEGFATQPVQKDQDW